jgi:hypothetical protein
LRLRIPGRLINVVPETVYKSLCSTALVSFDQIGKTTAVHAYATNTQN